MQSFCQLIILAYNLKYLQEFTTAEPFWQQINNITVLKHSITRFETFYLFYNFVRSNEHDEVRVPGIFFIVHNGDP